MKSALFQDQAQEKLSEIKDNFNTFLDKAKPVAEDAFDRSKEFYKNTMEKLPENSDKYLLWGVAGLTIGFIGYRIGKNRNQRTMMKQISHTASGVKKELSPIMNELVAPALKFVKLWMFYRLSV